MQVLSSDIQHSLQFEAKRMDDAGHTDVPVTESSSAPAPSSSDSVELSKEAKDKNSAEKSPEGKELSEEEQKEVEDLKKRDQEVRIHEQAHAATGGQYVTGGPTYEYEKGPDGTRYATGGHVSIDTSPIADDPEATIEKAQIIKRAALAPAEPSSTDRSVAAKATQMEQQARQELNGQNGASDKSNETGGLASLISDSGYSKSAPSTGQQLDISA